MIPTPRRNTGGFSRTTSDAGDRGESLDFGICVLEGGCADLILEIFNDVQDPQSVLELTAVEVHGSEFSLAAGPALPMYLPGDGSRAAFTVRFCPRGPPALGVVSITAPNAYPTYRIVSLGGDGNVQPTCDADGPYHGVAGYPVFFDGTGSGDPDPGPLDYSWDFGTEGPASAAAPFTPISPKASTR